MKKYIYRVFVYALVCIVMYLTNKYDGPGPAAMFGGAFLLGEKFGEDEHGK